MNLHNVGRVIAFEVTRSLRKPTFWVLSLAIPVLIAAVFGLVYFSNTSADEAANQQERFSFTYTDQSDVIAPEIATAFGGTRVTDSEAAIKAVEDGTSTAHIDFPADLVHSPTRIVAQDEGLIGSGKYTTVAQAIVKGSVAKQIGDPVLSELATSGVTVDQTLWRDGAPSGGIWEFLPPLLFLVLFYLAIMMLGNQMLNVTLEEKENRVTEMILTTIRPTSLIAGKVIALAIVGVVQGLVFMLPVILGIAFVPSDELASLDLSQVVIDPGRIAVGALLFLAGFGMFTGLLVAIGSIMPSAKEAGSSFAVVIIALFLPFYALPLVLSEPQGMASQIFTFFPLTAPITAMLRNAAGALNWWETTIVLVELFAAAFLLLALGVRLFRTGSISYDAKLNVRKALGVKG
jgi:ABC-2 type transport system permease protein